MLQSEAFEQFLAHCAALLGNLLFCQHQAIGGMGTPRQGLLLARLQFFPRVLSNRFQHHEPRFTVRLLHLLQQAFVHHGCGTVEQVQIEIAFGVADSFHALQRASSHEHR